MSQSFRSKDLSPCLSRFNSQREIKTLNIERYERYVLAVENQYAEHELEIYEWRQKTDFPIVKVDSYKVTHQKMGRTYLEIVINSFSCKLGSLSAIPIFKMLYLLKESFIALERLSDKFGTFEISAQMFGIDSKNHCKVWINENFSLNHTSSSKQTLREFYFSTVDIFEERTNVSQVSSEFYSKLRKTTSFWEGLKQIEEFAKINKIMIPKEFKHSEEPSKLAKNISSPNLNWKNNNSPHFKSSQLEPGKNSIETKDLRRTIAANDKNLNLSVKKDTGDYSQQRGLQTFTKSDKNLTKKIEEMMKQRSSFKPLAREKDKNKFSSFKPKVFASKGEGESALKKVRSGNFNFNYQSHARNKNDHQQVKLSQCKESRLSFQQKEKSPIREEKKVVNQTRSTSFIDFSKDTQESRLAFGNNRQISEISHKKRSEIEDFNKDVESILCGIDDKGAKNIQNSQSGCQLPKKSYTSPHKRQQSLLQRSQKIVEPQSLQKISPTDLCQTQKVTSSSYGFIDDSPKELTFDDIMKKYEDRGWNKSINELINTEEDLKHSIHNDEGETPKTPVSLKHLDKIKGEDFLNESFEEDRGQ